MEIDELKQLNGDCKATFVDFEAGRRVYKWLEQICFENKQTEVVGQPNQTSFNNGMRDVLIEIKARIRMATEPPPELLETINTKEK